MNNVNNYFRKVDGDTLINPELLFNIKNNIINNGFIWNDDDDTFTINIKNVAFLAIDMLTDISGETPVANMNKALQLLNSLIDQSDCKDMVLELYNEEAGAAKVAKLLVTSNDYDIQMTCLALLLVDVSANYVNLQLKELDDVGDRMIKELEIENGRLKSKVESNDREKECLVEELKKLKEENYKLKVKNDKLKRTIDHNKN